MNHHSGVMSTKRRNVLLGTLGVGIGSLFGSKNATAMNPQSNLETVDESNVKYNDTELFGSQGHQLPAKRVTDNDQYDNEPHLYRLKNNDLLLIYRRAEQEGGSSGHAHNSGRIISQRSKDWGRTWESPVTVADTEFDTRNQSVVYDRESGIITVMYRTYDVSTGNTMGGFYKISNNNGQSWSKAKEIELEFIKEAPDLRTPFGDFTRTSNGLLTTWVGEGVDDGTRVTEGIFSTDGGKTWGNNVKIIDSADYDLFLTEPVPEAYTEDKVWVFGRDNDNARFFAVQSIDGGITWSDAVFFSPSEMETGTPGWFEMTNPNELTMVWGDRTNNRMRSLSVSARLAWQDPTLIEEQPVRDLAVQLANDNAEFGYASTENVGRDRRHTLITWYDEDVSPNIWIASLGGDAASQTIAQQDEGGTSVPIDGDSIKLEAGSIERTEIPASADGTWDSVAIERFDITFSTPFDEPPAVVVTTNAASGLNGGTSNITTDGFTAQILNYRTSPRPGELDWIAIGEK